MHGSQKTWNNRNSIHRVVLFTPLLTGLLAIVGFSWLIGYLDFVLFPALFLFIGITVYALWRDGHLGSNQAKKEIKDE